MGLMVKIGFGIWLNSGQRFQVVKIVLHENLLLLFARECGAVGNEATRMNLMLHGGLKFVWAQQLTMIQRLKLYSLVWSRI